MVVRGGWHLDRLGLREEERPEKCKDHHLGTSPKPGEGHAPGRERPAVILGCGVRCVPGQGGLGELGALLGVETG